MSRGDEVWWSVYSRQYDWLWEGPLTAELARLIRVRIGAVPGVLLDAGSGTGLLTTQIAGSGRVVGMDRSPSMLTLAAKRPGQWLLADVRRPPFAPQSLGAVVAANVVHLGGRPYEVVEALASLVRPGGRLLLCWPCDKTGVWRVFRAELRLGVPAPRALARLMARLLIGVSAVVAGAPRRTQSRCVLDATWAVATAAALIHTHAVVLDGLQHVVVLARPPVPPEGS